VLSVQFARPAASPDGVQGANAFQPPIKPKAPQL
jgi:hypothetical protein